MESVHVAQCDVWCLYIFFLLAFLRPPEMFLLIQPKFLLVGGGPALREVSYQMSMIRLETYANLNRVVDLALNQS